jgi:hypothetical protein
MKPRWFIFQKRKLPLETSAGAQFGNPGEGSELERSVWTFDRRISRRVAVLFHRSDERESFATGRRHQRRAAEDVHGRDSCSVPIDAGRTRRRKPARFVNIHFSGKIDPNSFTFQISKCPLQSD